MSRFINPVPQFWLDNGSVATSGKMEFYENRDYSTLKATYANNEMTIANTNPVNLDGQGRMPACFGEGLYSVKLYAYDNAAIDKKGSLQWTRDDVDLSGGGSGAFDDWSAVVTYALGAAVKDNAKYYILYGSPTSKGERPSTTPTKWEEVTFLTIWNENKTYPENEIVVINGLIYRSLENNNTDEPPSAKWANLTFNDSVSGDFSVGGNIDVGGSIDVDGSAQFGGTLDALGKARFASSSYADGSTAGATIETLRMALLYSVSGAINTIRLGEGKALKYGNSQTDGSGELTISIPGVSSVDWGMAIHDAFSVVNIATLTANVSGTDLRVSARHGGSAPQTGYSAANFMWVAICTL